MWVSPLSHSGQVIGVEGLGDFESSSVQKGLFCLPLEGFFRRGTLLGEYLVGWDLVFGSGSPPGRFGDEGHYECFPILMSLLCHL